MQMLAKRSSSPKTSLGEGSTAFPLKAPTWEVENATNFGNGNYNLDLDFFQRVTPRTHQDNSRHVDL